MAYFPDDMPKPEVLLDTEEFWQACTERRLMIQRCSNCGTFRHTPKPACPACHSLEFDWQESRGDGEVFTYVVVHHAASPLLRERVPYNVVVVRLDDCGGVLVTSNLLDCPDDEIRIGMRVKLRWDDVGDGVWLYRFAPAESDTEARGS